MATTPMSQQPNPQGAAPQPGGADAAAQANPLQVALGRLAMTAKQLGSQNATIQPEMEQITQLFVQALQKVSQAASGPPQQGSAPMQQ